jgi:DNA polymerase-3 subunit delta
MANTVHAFDYLDAAEKHPPAAVCVAFGDEPFLKRLVLQQLRRAVIGGDAAEVPFATFEEGKAEWRDVLDELSTVSLFGGGGRRLVVVEQADKFVSDQRARLEDYVARPRPSGVLILDVQTWAANTRLYKAVAESGLQVECRLPERKGSKNKSVDEARLKKWLTVWAKQQHELTLASQAADVLLELVGPELGLLDQDLAKLALFTGAGGKVTPELVRDVVGGWRAKTIWDTLDAAADGDAAEALRQLDRLLQAGEHPQALFGQISWSLRRFTLATRIFQRAERQGRRIGLRDALEQAGFRKWPAEALVNAEKQMKQLGRQRAGQMYRWLLDLDLSLKGSHSQDDRARWALEQLLLRMAKQPQRR